ncbi:signal recognition particle-docking protein FtsY, partial [Rhodospirillum rubrum]|uniref:signal recognition particle-docking protein FtsY n=2 Tax=Rhodospirillum rubrum TaxID=1085 RepID=UPI0028AA01B8
TPPKPVVVPSAKPEPKAVAVPPPAAKPPVAKPSIPKPAPPPPVPPTAPPPATAPEALVPESLPEVIAPQITPEAAPPVVPEAIPEFWPEVLPEPVAEPVKVSFFARLRGGLSRTSGKLVGGIMGLVSERKLDDQALEDLEDLLITADIGVETAGKLTRSLAKERFGKNVTGEEIRGHFADEIATILGPVARPLEIDGSLKPHVVLVVGVNGSGKTTTIGKIANQLVHENKRVLLAAGDTFRAAAVEQLRIWGDRTGCEVIARDTGADSAGLAFDALQKARAEGYDVLLIDTAGRLHNKTELMEELKKVVRVLRKIDPAVPHTCLQVLDATVGQNAHQQVKVFQEMTDVSGLVMTKLDGTAKGGVVVALADKFGLPVHYVGIGEGIDDLRPFSARDFARGLMDLD